MILYSAATGGFYDPAIHGDAMPDDAIAIGARRHAELLAAQASGRRVIARDGRPVIAADRRAPIAELRERAVAATRREAGRRIRAIAGLEQQSNDNAALALAALTGDRAAAAGALARRKAIDAIRTASNAIGAEIAKMPAANLAAFDPTKHRLWPKD